MEAFVRKTAQEYGMPLFETDKPFKAGLAQLLAEVRHCCLFNACMAGPRLIACCRGTSSAFSWARDRQTRTRMR